MVALATGLILMTGIIQFYVSNKQTYRAIDANSRIQENARFAMDLLSRHIHMAGYRVDTATDPFGDFPLPNFTGHPLAAGEVIGGSATDVVIRYQADGVVEDCAGSGVIAAGTPVVVHFSLDGNNALQCQTSLGGPVSLISRFNQLAFLYGVDTDGDGSANCYDDAVALNANNPTVCGVSLDTPWKEVVSLRVRFVLEAEQNYLSVAGNQPLRKSYSTTISFRNHLP